MVGNRILPEKYGDIAEDTDFGINDIAFFDDKDIPLLFTTTHEGYIKLEMIYSDKLENCVIGSNTMKIYKIDKSDAGVAKEIIRQAYLPLLMKYHDEKENPANKSLEDIEYDLQRENSASYILYIDNTAAGYVRVGQRNKGEYSIADLAILVSAERN